MGKTRRRAKKTRRGGGYGLNTLYKSYGNRDLLDDNYRYAKPDPSTIESIHDSNVDKSTDFKLIGDKYVSRGDIIKLRFNKNIDPKQKTAMLQPLYQKNAQATSDLNKYGNRVKIDMARDDKEMKDYIRDIARIQNTHTDNLRKALRGYGGKSRRSTRRRT